MSARPATRDIAVECVQRGRGVPEGGKPLRLSQRDGSLDPRMVIPCANPECRKGGFLLRREIERLLARGETTATITIGCAGYIGPVRTEKGPARGCENELEAKIAIAYAGPASAVERRREVGTAASGETGPEPPPGA